MLLWDWSLAVYDQADVAPAALALQDHHGQNVSFLLWSVWAGRDDTDLLFRAADLARRWNDVILVPVRSVRTDLKPPFDGIDEALKDQLRQDIKAAELGAEKVLLNALERLVGLNRGAVPARPALIAAAKAWGPSPPEAALARLARALT